MNTSTAFHFSDTDEYETEALKELNDFLARPNSIGLDNLKEVFRNMVQLMMEVKGYSTGYALHHLVYGEHSSLAPAGILRGDEEKRRKIEELQHLMDQIDRMIFMEFDRLYTHVQNRIEVITENIENRIEKLDETIEDAIEDDLDEKIINDKKEKRGRLKKFMQRIKTREKQLQEVKTSEEVIEVEASISNDIADLRNGTPEPQPIKPSPFAMVTEMLKSRRTKPGTKSSMALGEFDTYEDSSETPKANTSAWSQETAELPYWLKAKKSSSYRRDDDTDSGETSGDTSGGDDEEAGGKEKDEDIEPPRVEL